MVEMYYQVQSYNGTLTDGVSGALMLDGKGC